MHRPHRTFAVAIALIAAAAPARAEGDAALPPERPTTPYEAKVRDVYEMTTETGMKSGGDTVAIRVSGARLRETSQILEEKTVIVDTEQRSVLEFDEKSDEHVAAKFPLNDAPIPYVGGRSALAAFDSSWPPPTVAGQEKVAGRKCTVLHYGKPEEHGIAACVSEQGVVMRAKLVSSGYEREFELLEFDAGRQDEKHFAPPPGWKVVDGASE